MYFCHCSVNIVHCHYYFGLCSFADGTRRQSSAVSRDDLRESSTCRPCHCCRSGGHTPPPHPGCTPLLDPITWYSSRARTLHWQAYPVCFYAERHVTLTPTGKWQRDGGTKLNRRRPHHCCCQTLFCGEHGIFDLCCPNAKDSASWQRDPPTNEARKKTGSKTGMAESKVRAPKRKLVQIQEAHKTQDDTGSSERNMRWKRPKQAPTFARSGLL